MLIIYEQVETANDIDGNHNNGDGDNIGDGNSNKNGGGDEQSWISRQSGSMLGPGLTLSGARPVIGHQLHPVCHQYVSVRSTTAQIVQSPFGRKVEDLLGESE